MGPFRVQAGLEIKRQEAGGNGAANSLAARNPAPWARSGHLQSSAGSLADESGDGGEEGEDVAKERGFGGVGQAEPG